MELTEDAVIKVIEKFWHLNASKAPIKEFLPLMSPDVFIDIDFLNIKFRGIAELADHQIGKLSFFDRKFELFLIETKVEDNRAISKTKGAWHASTWTQNAAYSQRLIADIEHTWTTTLSEQTNEVIVLGHICHTLKYREGFSPTATEKEFSFECALNVESQKRCFQN